MLCVPPANRRNCVFATTILDRLLHDSQEISIRGASCRLREKRWSGRAARTGTETAMIRPEGSRTRARTDQIGFKSAVSVSIDLRFVSHPHKREGTATWPTVISSERLSTIC